MPSNMAFIYSSHTQKARVVTEYWGAENIYCPNCSSPKLDWLKPGNKASDYKCPRCGFWYQLKSQQAPIRKSITDGAYAAMMEAIQNDRLPSFYFMHYEITNSPSPLRSGGEGRGEEAQIKFPLPVPLPAQSRGEGKLWLVRNLLLVPHFAFPPSAIVKRPPLAETARRAGWVGCNFDLTRIPAEARIAVVTTLTQRSAPVTGRSNVMARRAGDNPELPKGSSIAASEDGRSPVTFIVPAAEVRAQFQRVKPLKDISIKERGWTLDVLNLVRRVCNGRDASPRRPRTAGPAVPTNEFTNGDIYAHARELEQLHPDNRHVRDKIRQQLQVLRDAGLLIHVGTGVWRLP